MGIRTLRPLQNVIRIEPATLQIRPLRSNTLRILRNHPCTRGFTTHFNPAAAFGSGASAQTLKAHSVFPYPAQSIFEIIADITAYPKFIPHLVSSTISQHSTADARLNRKWPQVATLTIGYSSGPVEINESFTSRVFCVPPLPRAAVPPRTEGHATDKEAHAGIGFVEALSGSAVKSKLDESLIAHHLTDKPAPSSTRSEPPLSSSPYSPYSSFSPFSSQPSSQTAADDSSSSPIDFLRTRWTIRPLSTDTAEPETDVMLSIEYKFRNIMFEMLASPVAPRLADGILRVFETRARKLLDKDG